MSDTSTSIPQNPVREIVRLPEETTAFARNTDESSFTSVSGSFYETAGATALAPVIDIDRLYDAPPGLASQMVRALELLKQAIDFLSEAKKCDNPMDSDRYVQDVQLTLPKLFACRSIGDGFGVIINSLHFAFANLHGTPLTTNQVGVMWRILRELRTHPVMLLEQGVQHAEELENCGLEVDPPDFGDLLEGYESAE